MSAEWSFDLTCRCYRLSQEKEQGSFTKARSKTMICEKCKNVKMTKRVLQGGLTWDYSEILEFICPECDHKFTKVA
jgi:DNA-directed RNA polymerase subunit M/transcription elongation factor TFIIS